MVCWFQNSFSFGSTFKLSWGRTFEVVVPQNGLIMEFWAGNSFGQVPSFLSCSGWNHIRPELPHLSPVKLPFSNRMVSVKSVATDLPCLSEEKFSLPSSSRLTGGSSPTLVVLIGS